jgi:hypothetical protein
MTGGVGSLWHRRGRSCLRFASTGLSAEQAHRHREPQARCQQRRLEGRPSATTEAVAYESLSEVATHHQRPQHLQACRGPRAATCRHNGGEDRLRCEHRHRCRERSAGEDRVTRHPLRRSLQKADVVRVTTSNRHRHTRQPASELSERHPDEPTLRTAPSIDRIHRPTVPGSRTPQGSPDGDQPTMNAQRETRKRASSRFACVSRRWWLLQVQQRLEGEIDTPLLLGGEMARVVARPCGIDRAGLLDEHARRCAVEVDLGPR